MIVRPRRRGHGTATGTMAETRFQQTEEKVLALLESGRHKELRGLLSQYQPTEIAEDFEAFSPDQQIVLLGQMSTEQAVDVFECLEEPHQQELLDRLPPERQATFLREMEPDERADLFQELPEELAAEFLALLPRKDKEEVRELVSYEAHTAGGLMTPEFAWVSPDMTVADAIGKFRQNYADLEMVYYIYVLDAGGRLVGLVSMRQLLLRDPHARIEEIMFRNVISVTPDTDQEEVAQILTLYDFLALPVADESRQMLGIVTFDDIADVMEEEAGEDLERFGAVLPSELSYERTSIWDHVRRRAPWLVTLLLLSSVSGFVIAYAEGHVLEFALLVTLFPMLTATAGNAGTQVATLMIRGLATGEIARGDIWPVLWKELFVGLAIGVVLAVLGFGRAMLGGNPEVWLFLGFSVGAALIAMLLIANLMGALLPLMFHMFGWDPALMSSPLLATITDILSAIVYFSTAYFVSICVF